LPNSQVCSRVGRRFAKGKALLRMGLRVYQASITRKTTIARRGVCNYLCRNEQKRKVLLTHIQTRLLLVSISI